MLVIQDHAIVFCLSSELSIFSLLFLKFNDSLLLLNAGKLNFGVSLTNLSLKVPYPSLQFVDIFITIPFTVKEEFFGGLKLRLTFRSVSVQFDLVMNGL